MTAEKKVDARHTITYIEKISWNIFAAQCETETHKHIVYTVFSLWRTVIMPSESDLGNQALFGNFISERTRNTKKNQEDDVLT